jgi:hypothetical protein
MTSMTPADQITFIYHASYWTRGAIAREIGTCPSQLSACVRGTRRWNPGVLRSLGELYARFALEHPVAGSSNAPDSPIAHLSHLSRDTRGSTQQPG